jgi:hypothetical protein
MRQNAATKCRDKMLRQNAATKCRDKEARNWTLFVALFLLWTGLLGIVIFITYGLHR